MALRPPIINVMADAARRSARPLLRDFGELQQLQVSRRAPTKFVSSARNRTEDSLRRDLCRARTDYDIAVASVGKEKPSLIPTKRPCWLVDPLSGLDNFAHGVPHFCLSIAALDNSGLMASVIYDPLRDETFWAENGSGSHLDSQRLRVSAREDLYGAMLSMPATSFQKPNPQQSNTRLHDLSFNEIELRRSGSIGLDLAYVAAGRFDGCIAIDEDPITLAAGVPLVLEAGGFATAIDNTNNQPPEDDIVAANPSIHDHLIRTLTGF